MASISSRVSDYYQSIGASPRPGVSHQELTAFESATRLLLPEPVREFYLVLDGLDGEVPEFGFHHLQLWRLSELSRVSDRVAEFRGIPDYGPIVHSLPDADQYVAFGDGAIWSHVLAFRLSADAGPIIWICGESYAVVASSFDEFWRAYLESPDAMLWPSRDQVKSPDA